MITIGSIMGIFSATGCAHHRGPAAGEQPPAPPQVVVVAPVLNLSDSSDWDPLKVTDIVASELQSFPNVVVIPVNRALAALALAGKDVVETPQDALDLASELGADATVVTAITEYSPYDPPIVGVLMQWYAPRPHLATPTFDPVSASRQASGIAPAASTTHDTAAPLVQVQRVYNAADETLLADLRSFAATRSGHGSPYAWRIYVKSQELFVRYCCWATIRSILLEREHHRVAPEPNETEQ